jgi:hypothetical protein
VPERSACAWESLTKRLRRNERRTGDIFTDPPAGGACATQSEKREAPAILETGGGIAGTTEMRARRDAG